MESSWHEFDLIDVKKNSAAGKCRTEAREVKFIDVLALVLLQDEQLVEQAVTAALEVDQPSKQHVLNCLSRLEEPLRPSHLQPPPALKLVTEPTADTSRYDRLRRGRRES